MKINIIIIASLFIFLSISINFIGQENKVNLYHPYIDASRQIDSAVNLAAKENKHVLLQIGGNWCSWCTMLHNFYISEYQVDSILKLDYIVTYINYSKENQNYEVLKRLEFPQRFGFPVLVILDAHGKRLHTQNTGYLEKGRGYDKEKVVEFLKQWSPSALKPENYKE